jgi:hypothetical protein
MLWGVREKSHLTCTLQGNSQFMLMLRAIPCLSSWLNLCAIRNEAAEPVHFLVVNHAALITAE